MWQRDVLQATAALKHTLLDLEAAFEDNFLQETAVFEHAWVNVFDVAGNHNPFYICADEAAVLKHFIVRRKF